MMMFVSLISGISIALEFDFDSNVFIVDLAFVRLVLYYGSDPSADLGI